ncbi:MAG: patatin family protein [Aestuariibacter sp.]|nr:patatin family protein [Aestuariibacter sp.]
MKSALVVEGGAMRGIFAAGVLDTFQLQHYNPFDMVLGVSAGATNAAGYVTGNAPRNRKIITRLATQREFFNPVRFMLKGHMTDVKWLWLEAQARYPINAEALATSTPLIAVITNMRTGEPEYHRVTADNIDVLMEATCALPMAYRTPPRYQGVRYVDGGVTDAIPVQYAYEQGFKDITVVLSQPWGYQKAEEKGTWVANKVFARYPKLIQAIQQRATRYNDTLAFIASPPADCRINVIVPPAEFGVGRLTMRRDKLIHGYQMGRHAAQSYLAQLRDMAA